jgi:uncharacterized protein YndB with AHSA1/START domain
MKKPDFVYVSYVAATPERVWDAMLAPAFTREFFGVAHDGEWKAGLVIRSLTKDGNPDCEARVIDFEPPRFLSLTWLRSLLDGEYREMPKAIATVQLEPLGDVVRITVTETHDEPVDESYLEGGQTGWPISIARLKTLVETGKPLPRIGARS